MMGIQEKFKIWSEKKFCVDGKQVVPLSYSDVGFLKDAFLGGYLARKAEEKGKDDG